MIVTYINIRLLFADMVTEHQWDTLNKAFGYEMIVLLMNEPMSIAKIGSQVPYETVHKRQIERIVESCYDINLIKVTPERGADKYTLNEIYFSKSELKKINRRAIARIMNPKDGRVGPSELHEISEEFFVQVERENCAVEPRAFTTQNVKPVAFDTQEEKKEEEPITQIHHDYVNQKSRFESYR